MTGFVAVPCPVPQTENAAFKYKGETVTHPEEIPHSEALTFGCSSGYVVQGPEIMRCWYGEWSVNQKSECVPGTPSFVLALFALLAKISTSFLRPS